MPTTLLRTVVLAAGAALTPVLGCARSDPATTPPANRADAHDHDHEHGVDDADAGRAHAGAETDHGHEETPLGTTMVGDLSVECWQGHGTVAPGKEMHLVVKLPYRDSGATIVRAWIGTADRLASRVARGEHAPAHDDYDIHAEAPDPLPDGAAWWIEVEPPDGARRVGSIPLR